jgi:hypothetical protein
MQQLLCGMHGPSRILRRLEFSMHVVNYVCIHGVETVLCKHTTGWVVKNYIYIQVDSRLVDITAGGDFLRL